MVCLFLNVQCFKSISYGISVKTHKKTLFFVFTSVQYHTIVRNCEVYLFKFSVCDPVMGDNKKMYVPKEILDVYKNDIIHLTDIITPNEYELE